MSGPSGAPGRPERPDPTPPSDQELIPRRPDEPAWMRLLAPIRSEGAAFRTVAWVAGGAIVIAAVVLLARAVS